MTILPTYLRAVQLRTIAEQGNDPCAYEIAAAEFDAIGMCVAAGRCRDRAALYFKTEKKETTKIGLVAIRSYREDE